MNPLAKTIELAFEHRKLPAKQVTVQQQVFSDTSDALKLASGKNHWKEVKWQDWAACADAVHTLSPEAFLYFLPSILTLSVEQPKSWLNAADAVILSLNRSPNPEYWDEWFLERFCLLTKSELDALDAWTMKMCMFDSYGSDDVWMRVLETISLLRTRART